MKAGLFASLLSALLIPFGASQSAAKTDSRVADLILIDAHVYTLRWGEPALDGTGSNTPRSSRPKISRALPGWA